MRYGLIGEKLGHSWSKIIHEELADYTYDLIPLSKEAFCSFMERKEFDAINVTIPYKQDVIPYLAELDSSAKAIGAVNTIVNQNGLLKGYNTDYLGFIYTLKRYGIDVTGKKCLVLGNGGASKAVIFALKMSNASEIIIVNRTLREGVISYEECYRDHTDADFIVNTTSLGMYPAIDHTPLDLTKFQHATAIIDIIYNPLKTMFLAQAEELGKIAVNGLPMLVAQAKYASEYFTSTKISDHEIAPIIKELSSTMQG